MVMYGLFGGCLSEKREKLREPLTFVFLSTKKHAEMTAQYTKKLEKQADGQNEKREKCRDIWPTFGPGKTGRKVQEPLTSCLKSPKKHAKNDRKTRRERPKGSIPTRRHDKNIGTYGFLGGLNMPAPRMATFLKQRNRKLRFTKETYRVRGLTFFRAKKHGDVWAFWGLPF